MSIQQHLKIHDVSVSLAVNIRKQYAVVNQHFWPVSNHFQGLQELIACTGLLGQNYTQRLAEGIHGNGFAHDQINGIRASPW